MAEGIEVRHAKKCRSRDGGRCNCEPTYQAHVWSNRDMKRIRKTFPSIAAAKGWRSDAVKAVREGTLQAPSKETVREVWAKWHAAALVGEILNRSGDRYKPSALRSFEQSMRLRVLPAFGARRFTDLRRTELQKFVRRLHAQGLAPATVQTTLLPLQAMYRHAVEEGVVAVNQTAGLKMPAVRSAPKRIASPSEAAALLGALPVEDRPVWGTALYAGLRLGELQALEWDCVDLATGVIRVEKGWDRCEGEAIAPKSEKGRRSVPIAGVLRDLLTEHRMRCPWEDGLSFGRTAARPFSDSGMHDRAGTAWKHAGVEPIGFHEARHTFASLMIAAGVNAKALSTFMGREHWDHPRPLRPPDARCRGRGRGLAGRLPEAQRGAGARGRSARQCARQRTPLPSGSQRLIAARDRL